MNQLIARQVINANWFVVSLALTVSFVFFLRDEMGREGWYAERAGKAAIALAVYFAGETIARGWSVVLLKFYAKGADAFVVEQRYPIALFGWAVSLVGAACALRIFSPPGWRHRGWVVSMAIAAAFTVAAVLF